MTPGRSGSIVLAALVLAATGIAQLPVLHTFDSVQRSHFGYVGAAGDVDGDGTPDLIVGAPRYQSTYAGVIKIFSGRTGALIRVRSANTPQDYFGEAVSGVGDVDGDARDDVIVGASWTGKAYVYSGATGWLIRTHTYPGRFGKTVSGIGDANGDGYGDYAVGAPDDSSMGFFAGAVRIFSGFDGSLLYAYFGTQDDRVGASVSGAGDVNADGYADFVYGAPGESLSAGTARVRSGFDGSLLYTFSGNSSYDGLGASVSGAGDVNADGYPDVVIGAPGDDGTFTDGGRVHVFSGFDGSVLWSFDGDGTDAWMGQAVSGAGDVNGDGFKDLLIATPYRYNPYLNRVDVFSGRDGTRLATFRGSPNGWDEFGESLCALGDLNGDGFDDVAIGAPDYGYQSAGRAQVFTVCGAQPYGAGLGGTQTLALAWSPGLPGNRTSGFVTVQGAAPAASGTIALSWVPAMASAFGVTLLVDDSPGNTVTFPYTHDAFGSAVLSVDLQVPTLAETVLHAQAFELGAATAPAGVFASNGLRLLFSR